MEFMTADQINEKLISLSRNERKLTHEILNHIILFQKVGGYLKLGYSSMHQYLTRALGYSDDMSYRRLKAAQLMQEVPEVEAKLKSGELNLTQASLIQKSVETAQKEKGTKVSKEAKVKIIQSIEKMNNFETKSILVSELELTPTLDDKVSPQSNNTVRIELNLTQEQYKKLKLVQSLLSHKISDQNLASVIELLLDQNLNKNSFTKDCMTRSFRLNQRKVNQRKTEPNQKRYIPAFVKQVLFKRSNGCCEFISKEGVRCQSRYKLQIDHFEVPFSQGGENSIENCKLLCSNHNLHRASLMGIGFETTSKFLPSSTESFVQY